MQLVTRHANTIWPIWGLVALQNNHASGQQDWNLNSRLLTSALLYFGNCLPWLQIGESHFLSLPYPVRCKFLLLYSKSSLIHFLNVIIICQIMILFSTVVVILHFVLAACIHDRLYIYRALNLTMCWKVNNITCWRIQYNRQVWMWRIWSSIICHIFHICCKYKGCAQLLKHT